MSIFNYLRKKPSTASVAKQRLQIIISHERNQRSAPDYIPQLQQEIMDVISKYIPINKEKVTVNLERLGDSSVLELNVTLPDEVTA